MKMKNPAVFYVNGLIKIQVVRPTPKVNCLETGSCTIICGQNKKDLFGIKDY